MENASQMWRSILQVVFGLGLSFLFFFMMGPFIVPLLLGAVCALLCYPTFQFLKRKKLPRPLAAGVTTVGLATLIFLPLSILLAGGAYEILNQLKRFKVVQQGQTLEGIMEHPWVQRLLGTLARFGKVDKDWLYAQSTDIFHSLIEKLSTIVAQLLAGIPALAIGVFVIMVSTFFFLDGARFLRFLQQLSPLGNSRSGELYEAFEKSCRGVVAGLFVSGLVQGLLMSIFFQVTDLPNPLLIGILTVIAGMIPVVGSAPIWIAAVVYFAANGMVPKAGVMLAGGILISSSDNIVRPWMLQGQSDMHPLLGIVSVFGAVALFGPIGIFLGPVIAAVFVSFLRILAIEISRDRV